MSKSMQISLRAGSRIYLNGAVVRVDRKVTLELLNEVVFLLESHVLQPNETTTPLRQLYFVLQTMLMDPVNAPAARGLFVSLIDSANGSFRNETILSQLDAISTLVAQDRIFDAMREIRALFAIEDEIFGTGAGEAPQAA
jgi:flagellar protein FlbT